MPKSFRQRKVSSSSSSSDEETVKQSEESTGNIKDKIEEIKFLQKQRERTHGLDVYSLAIGESETVTTISQQIENDPWKSRTGGLVDMKVILEKRGNEIVKNMHSTFAKETNQRDEDAEMQRFIEEQLNKKKQAEKNSDQNNSNEDSSKVPKFKSPEDALFDVPKYLLENTSRHKSEETLSEQMLSGIPEVDLGIQEKIRNIEETERAKQQGAAKTTVIVTNKKQLNENSSVNFVQHKRFDESVLNDKNRLPQHKEQKPTKPEPVVGDAPKHELLQPQKRKDTDSFKSKSSHTEPKKSKNETTEKASDDYCLEKFKKNMKFNRGNKIKIA
ncbi:unnamed protein product [Brachionus calyciflorus]|uniref:Uncharacterized protein n=1 Tax=Brachionus calyciflorus TaxID=104777 RepID=A0A813YWI3_9BILA|nr:unnamed protein product [Brachionus calyciflorus]